MNYICRYQCFPLRPQTSEACIAPSNSPVDDGRDKAVASTLMNSQPLTPGTNPLQKVQREPESTVALLGSRKVLSGKPSKRKRIKVLIKPKELNTDDNKLDCKKEKDDENLLQNTDIKEQQQSTNHAVPVQQEKPMNSDKKELKLNYGVPLKLKQSADSIPTWKNKTKVQSELEDFLPTLHVRLQRTPKSRLPPLPPATLPQDHIYNPLLLESSRRKLELYDLSLSKPLDKTTEQPKPKFLLDSSQMKLVDAGTKSNKERDKVKKHICPNVLQTTLPPKVSENHAIPKEKPKEKELFNDIRNQQNDKVTSKKRIIVVKMPKITLNPVSPRPDITLPALSPTPVQKVTSSLSMLSIDSKEIPTAKLTLTNSVNERLKDIRKLVSDIQSLQERTLTLKNKMGNGK